MSRSATIVAVADLLVVTRPGSIAVALAILTASPEPVFYRARWVGLYGREFHLGTSGASRSSSAA